MSTAASGCGTSITNRRCTSCGRPALLDLYCAAGGAAMGYHRAGLCVTGVDIIGQPRFPFTFYRADAVAFAATCGHLFAGVHASPTCQLWTAYRRKGHGVGEGYTNLIPATRAVLVALDRPWVIENVQPAAAELRSPTLLCGSMFIRTDGTPLDVQRHRLFEVGGGVELVAPTHCDHRNPHWTPRFTPASNRRNLRKTVEVGVRRIPLDVQQRAMGIDWMRLHELSLALPPAYTEHVGAALLAAIEPVSERAA